MPFLLTDSDQAYADQQSFQAHVQRALATLPPPPVPADQQDRQTPPDAGVAPMVDSSPPPSPDNSPALTPTSPLPTSFASPSAAPPSGGLPPIIPAQVGGRAAFAQSFAPYAAYGAAQLGIDPSIVTAMAISESGGGNLPGYSFFGMKGSPLANGSTNQPTWELVNGQRVNQNAGFATFSDPKTAVDAWVQFIKQHTPGAVGAQSPEQFAAGLKQGGYMTDTAQHYADTLKALGAGSGGPTTSGVPELSPGLSSDVTAGPASVPPTSPTPNQQTTTSPSPSSPFDEFVNHVKQSTNGTVDLSAIGQAKDNAVQTIGSGLNAVGSDAQAFADHVRQATGGLVDLTGGSIATLGTPTKPDEGNPSSLPPMPNAPTPSDSLTNPSLQTALPQPPPTPPSAPPDQPQQSMWDKLGQGISDVFKGIFGGNADFIQNPTVGPSSPLGSRVLQRNAEGGLNPGDVLQAEGDELRAGGAAIIRAGGGTGDAFIPAGLNPLQAVTGRPETAYEVAQHTPGLNPAIWHDVAAKTGTSVPEMIATAGLGGYLGAAGGALAEAGNPLAFLVDPQGQLTPFGLLRKTPTGLVVDRSGAQGSLGEALQLQVPEGMSGFRPGRPALPAPTYGPQKQAIPLPGSAPLFDRLEVTTGPRIAPGTPEGVAPGPDTYYPGSTEPSGPWQPPAPRVHAVSSAPTPETPVAIFDQNRQPVGFVSGQAAAPTPSQATNDVAAQLGQAESEMAALRAAHPQMSDGSAAASGLGRRIDQLRAQLASETPPAQGLIPNANRARATAADQAAAAEGIPGGRAGRLATNDINSGAEPPVEAGQAFTRTPQGDIVRVPQELSAADLLQAMIDEAKRTSKGSPQVLADMQSQLDSLYAPTELAAGFNPRPVVQFAQNVGANIRTAFSPASAAPQPIQDALNTLDGNIRLAQNAVQRQTLLGQMNAQQASQVITGVRLSSTQRFLQDVAHSTDGVQPIVQGTPPPASWSSGGKLSPALAGVWLSPETAAVVKNTLNTDVTVPGLEGLARISGAIKQIGLTGSPFHFIQEELQAVRLGAANLAVGDTGSMMGRSTTNAANPAAFKSWITDKTIAGIADRLVAAGGTLDANSGEGVDLTKTLQGMATRGLVGASTGGVGTYATQRARGVPEDQARQQALIGAALGGLAAGPIGSVIGPAIFERQIPTLKIIGFKVLADSGLSDQAAATMVNNTFGGQNLVRMARDPNFEAILRSAVLAPDWWESWARNVGAAIPGMPVAREAGDASRKYVAATVAGAALTLEGLNYLLSGHFTNENQPNHQLDLEIPADKVPGAPQSAQGGMAYIDVLGPLKPMAQLVTSGGDVGAFAKSRAGVVPSLAVAGLQNKNASTGGTLVQPGTPWPEAGAQIGAYEFGQANPAGAQTPARAFQQAGPAAGALAAATGSRVTLTPGQPVSHPVQQEIDRLNKAGYSGVSLPYPQKSFVYNNSKITLSADERSQLGVMRAKLVTDRLGPIVNTPAWQKWTDDEKANHVALVVSRSTTDAEHQFLASLTAAALTDRLIAGREVRGKPVNQPAPSSIPSFLAPIATR